MRQRHVVVAPSQDDAYSGLDQMIAELSYASNHQLRLVEERPATDEERQECLMRPREEKAEVREIIERIKLRQSRELAEGQAATEG